MCMGGGKEGMRLDARRPQPHVGVTGNTKCQHARCTVAKHVQQYNNTTCKLSRCILCTATTQDAAPARVMLFVNTPAEAAAVADPLRSSLWSDHRMAVLVPPGACACVLAVCPRWVCLSFRCDQQPGCSLWSDRAGGMLGLALPTHGDTHPDSDLLPSGTILTSREGGVLTRPLDAS